ncbi:MAG: carbohydrate binding domain-containing protein [Duncaniella sp.]|nr:carbohydrate binding domain-containing protein [Duncaniella sp.]
MKHFIATMAAALIVMSLSAQPVTMTLDASKKGAPVQPTMYGIFFEDINFGADGGLYAEKVKNRSFEFPQHLAGWTTFGNVALMDDGPFDRAPHYVRLSPAGHAHKHTGLDNEGFFGVSWHAGEKLRLSVWARSSQPATLRAELVNPAADGETDVMASAKIKVKSPDWTKYSVVLKPNKGLDKGKLRIFLDKPDTVSVDVEHISLFPVDTWQGHENGMRRDLAQALADLEPGVFRFPGGCIVEGTDLDSRYQWKNTVGPVENRPTNENRWHYTFPRRFYPEYYQSNGLGFFEYFQLAEEIGAEPLPVVSVGLACQYQNNTPDAHVPIDQLEPYIQDAVDLVEFANGDTTTTWGALRASMGHPAPFGLKYIAVGNEQWGPEYVERLEKFVERLRKECPDIMIVGSSGPTSSGERFDYLWPEMRRLGVDLVDEHYYSNEEWFKNHAARYDSYPRNGSKVFAGEYACHAKGAKRNMYRSALCEAAFMTGLERNADVVWMATYAPLFAHKEGWQWRPDMIWFDNLSHSLTSSYHVQQLYSHNRGTHTLPLVGSDGTPFTGQDGLYASAVLDASGESDKKSKTPAGQYVIKIVNINDTPRHVAINLKGLPKRHELSTVLVTELTPGSEHSDSDESSIRQLTLSPSVLSDYTLPARSVSVISVR